MLSRKDWIDANLAYLVQGLGLPPLDRETGLPVVDDPPPPPYDWRSSPDLLPPPGSTVFGLHANSPERRAAQEAVIGRGSSQDTIYWHALENPLSALVAAENSGIVPRLELELTTALGDAGAVMNGPTSLWAQIAQGLLDEAMRPLFAGIELFGRPILVGLWHEGDLGSEQGAYGGVSAGTDLEFAAAWRHVVDFARGIGVQARWCWIMSGGYKDAVTRWNQMWPGHAYVDVVGWDQFNWYGVHGSTDWSDFESRLHMFGRYDWYLDHFPKDTDLWRPLMIGETGTGDGPGAPKDAETWLADMVGCCTEYDISYLTYFGQDYDDHTRALDISDSRKAGAALIGAAPRFAPNWRS